MPEGKKAAVPAPKPVREEDLYSAKTHLHQPVPVQETATVSATAQLADAPEGALPSEVRPEIVTWEKLCEAIKASGRSYNMEMIEKAYDLANTAHKGVCRRSGEPYICHPLAVARLVLDLGMDSESIAAALLHDVVEDTPTTLDDLKAAFGEEVALLVDGVTKLTKIQFSNIEELQAENLRKMLLAMSRDVRVMIIKLCDRLHNMRTGDAWPEQKRRDKARETMEVYAPIANRLGILNVKEELEDRSLHYLDPVGYEEISRMLSERAGEEFLAKVSGVIERRLAESGIEGATIKRRVKSIYGRPAAQHLLPHCEDDKRWPGTNTGRQQRGCLLCRELPGLHRLCCRRSRRGETAQRPDEQHPARTFGPDADEPRRRAEQNAQPFPRPALHQQGRDDQKREQRHQQRPAAQLQPLPQRIGAKARGGKHQHRRGQRQHQKRSPPDFQPPIHKPTLPVHIYVAIGHA